MKLFITVKIKQIMVHSQHIHVHLDVELHAHYIYTVHNDSGINTVYTPVVQRKVIH